MLYYTAGIHPFWNLFHVPYRRILTLEDVIRDVVTSLNLPPILYLFYIFLLKLFSSFMKYLLSLLRFEVNSIS